MNTLSWFRRGLAIALLLTSGLALAFAHSGPPAPKQSNNDVQDLVFLGETRPVLIRLHVRVDGKSIQTAWEDYVKYLFAYLDVNGDGVLDAVEAERVPSIEQIQGGVLGALRGRSRPASRAKTATKMDKMEMKKGKESKSGTAVKKGEASKTADTAKKSDTTKEADSVKKTDVAKKDDAVKKADVAKKDDVAKKSDIAKKTDVAKKADSSKDAKKKPTAAMPSMPSTSPPPTIEETPMIGELDTNKDGKVTLDELLAYYRKGGFNPFHIHLSVPQANGLDQLAILRGGADPTAQEISDAIFNLIDTNRDGKLSKEELAAAPAVLLRLDENDDEMIGIRELVPKKGSNASSMIAGFMSKGKGPDANESRKTLIPLAKPGEVPHDLVSALQARYGPKSKKPEEKKLSRKDLGLDEATFRQLDTNGDGVLDAKELAGFVKRQPDIELTVRLGERGDNESAVGSTPKNGRRTSLASNLTVKDDVAMLDLGVSRAEVRTSEEEYQMDTLLNIIRTQLVAFFKSADKDNKGYLTKEEAKKNPQFASIFKMADRDNDGKLTEKELNAFLDMTVELQKRATASSVTLVLSFDSRGLFDLLDTNGDGQLSLREMRGAVGLLEKFGDRTKNGYLTKADIPRTAKLTLRRGPSGEVDPQIAAFSAIYGGGNSGKPERQLTAGPLWFRKMDRNRDGDVSRKEWIFSDELFRKIDTDGDGLISAEEAQRYEAKRKKEK